MANLPKTLPASWFCSKPLYEFEKKAVFLKCWYLLGPVTRFIDEKPIEYEFAGVKLAAERVDGSVRVRRLPDNLDLPVKQTSSGLIFTALSPSAPTFSDFFPGLEDLLSRVDFTKLPFRRTLSYTGRFNWKTMVDGYQECLHCQYTHRAFSAVYPPTFYAVHNHGHYSRHVADPSRPDDGLFLYFFPVCTLNVYGGGMSSFRVCPTADPGVTRMEFDYYNTREGEAFEEYFRFVRRVALEDYELCEKAQANLERGVYSQGVLNPAKESGVRHYQQLVRTMVMEKFKEEEEEEAAERGAVEGTGAERPGVVAVRADAVDAC